MPTRTQKSPKFVRGPGAPPAKVAELLITPIEGPRANAVDLLKEYALQGIASFEAYKDQCVIEMATKARYDNPRSVTLSQMQHDKVTGASSFYVYYCKFKKYIKDGDLKAIQRSTSTSLAKARIPTTGLSTPAELIKSLRNYHSAGRLRASDYTALEKIVRDVSRVVS